MRKLHYLLVLVAIVLSVVCDWSFVSESLKLADTSFLWSHGRISGWIQIVFYCIVMDGFICIPALLMWDLGEDIKSKEL